MENYQRILFPYAYNILGSVDEAKDAIQDVMTNHLGTTRTNIENEKNYLIKSVINHAINIKNKLARAAKNLDVWLPEPVETPQSDTDMNLKDIASYSLMVLLEKLSPKERAVFILKEGFDYSHEEIADVLSGTVENSRKLLSRAKSKIEGSQSFKAPAKTKTPKTEILEAFVAAIRNRDTKTLESLLTQDIQFFADGGPNLNVVKKQCSGVQDVTDLLLFVHEHYNLSKSIRAGKVNHQPAVLYYEGGKLTLCQVVTIQDDKIVQISNVVDPEKLKGIQYQGGDQL